VFAEALQQDAVLLLGPWAGLEGGVEVVVPALAALQRRRRRRRRGGAGREGGGKEEGRRRESGGREEGVSGLARQKDDLGEGRARRLEASPR